MKNSLAAMAVVLASGSAYAGFQADYIDITGVGNAIRIDNTANGGINALYAAGHFNFQYDDVGGDRGLGQFSGGTFSTFCIELQTARDAMKQRSPQLFRPQSRLNGSIAISPRDQM